MASQPLISGQPSFYALLEVSQKASAEELRQAFRTLSKRYHPDTTALPAAAAAQAFQLVREGYAVLGDPQTRRLYDGQLQARLTPNPPFNPSMPSTALAGSTPDQRRPLSGGEWLALLLLGVTLLLSLAVGIGLAWLRGEG